MPLPKKHHYLPEWYLSRWKRPYNGEDVIWEFGRVGPRNELRARYRHPAATGYARDLYTLPNLRDEEAAKIETKFLQVIDDRGAKAVAMVENNEAAGPRDKAGLVQFILSMLHRSPERIEYLENRLVQELADNPLFFDEGPDFFRAGALNTFVHLVQSELMIERMMQLRAFFIKIGDGGYDLLTSDSPVMMSNGMAHREAFVMIPTGPRSLIILAEHQGLADHMANHSAKVLSKAINDAVTVQARKLVYGPSKKQARFIENRLNRPHLHLADAIDPVTGLVKWKI